MLYTADKILEKQHFMQNWEEMGAVLSLEKEIVWY